MGVRISYLVVIGMLFCCYGCAPSVPTQKRVDERNPRSEIFIDAYKIGVDDRLQINVWNSPALSVSMPVRPDGKITMPLIGDVMAAGKGPEELASTIKNQLSKYVRDPNVAVILTELRSQEFLSRVRVTGAVFKSLSIPYRQGMTVLDAVLEGGGVTEFSAPNRTKLHRKEGAKVAVYEIRLKDIMDDGVLQTNLLLRPGDIITVPERYF